MKAIQTHSKNKLLEFCRYLACGGATTLVNYTVYLAFIQFKVNFLAANTAAWSIAVLFAYWGNRLFVFHSRNHGARELLSFVSLRLLTLVAENLLLAVLIEGLAWNSGISKLLASAVTVAGNYFFCKYQVFQATHSNGTIRSLSNPERRKNP